MGTHARRRPVTAKAAVGVSCLLALGLAALVLLTGGSDPAATPDARDLAGTSATPSPAGSPTAAARPEASARPVTATPASGTPAGRPSVTATSRPTRTPTAAPTPASPTVPDVVGLTVEQAAARLAAAGYGHQVVCQKGEPTGTVAAQQPAAGQRWDTGGRVALFVAQGRCRGSGRGHPDNPWGN